MAAGGDSCTTPEHLLHQLHELADAELLGVLLAGGRLQPESVRLARELLESWGGLAALAGTSLALLRSYGLRHAQASALLVTGEIACRLARNRVPDQAPLSRPSDLARFLALRYHQRDQEVMGALFLSARRRLLGDKELYRGTMHRAAVEPREILKECLLRRARSFVLFHTHPSGDPTPSVQDLEFTQRMVQASRIMGIAMIDHLVLGATGQWVSIQARGGW
ncbi:MAG TPA: DNA repair protein RadC [Thermoanaerobaculia bacterium]|nr:DNA repair protein RadC [Thermoanaerobaculia bacterium]